MEKRYDFKSKDKKIQDLWKDANLYAYDKTSYKPVFSIDTPPPTVSGSLHIGHIFSYTQAEIIARYKRIRGYNLFYPFGFDDNGLPTERLVEREQKIRAKDLSREAFSALCLKTTEKYEAEFKSLWQSLGFSVDWSLEYQTISESTQRIAQRSLIELIEEGKAYTKESPVLWCTTCQTSIAQAEIGSDEKDTDFIQIRFDTQNDPITIATTRPEMLYGCVAIFAHPDDSRYSHLIGTMATVPIYGHEVAILADDQAEMDKGTGLVMCCTFGDVTDLTWYEKHELPYRETITADGLMSSNIPDIGGLSVKDARTAIIGRLQKNGYLLKSEQLHHSYQTHERCGSAIEILPSKQWYISLMPHKQAFLDAADQINWHPYYMKSRYIHWVENLKWDWCISRQRYFGVPFPVWYCDACGAIKLAKMDALPVNPLSTSPESACSCGHRSFSAESAVMDTWMTSSMTPMINKKWQEPDERTELKGPMSMRAQAHEIIRTWAFYSIAKSIFHTGEIPWKDIMISGFVLAKKGEKISKSKSNSTMTPEALIKDHAADAIRYWTAGNKLGTDTFFDTAELETAKRLMNKLWNASKFSLMHLRDYQRDASIELLPIDRWILERARKTTRDMADALDRYEMGTARQLIDDFFWNDYCDDYIELVKERLYQPEKHGERERKSAQRAVYETLLILLKCYGIYMPHITEEIYQSFYTSHEEKSMLHEHEWEIESSFSSSLFMFGDAVKAALSESRKYKSEHGLSMKDTMPKLTIALKPEFEDLLDSVSSDLKACTQAIEIEYLQLS
ncbi:MULTISPECIES: valine--tRNA ligase [unclassified Fusibacter]|uniref:valine--tRNA ligase n=1 Tax=unclassified Fusibacter TaxID=2624464 RepID=UPI0010134617|nr:MULTISPECIES: valine--tRNA ligase [unclassified Fusibacter]MCK8060132.1 valine--tRNA ligase [Fusibacter sp. A2]NPE22274.1 valine--tRNA ligase [Fusibacter sp. A1]RXV61047.1 valine--tRNA ligase [Fusibacter sp. A1]